MMKDLFGGLDQSTAITQADFPQLLDQQKKHVQQSRTENDLREFETNMLRRAALMPKNERQLFMSVAMAGRKIGDKINAKDQLSLQEKQQFATLREANKVMRTKMSGDLWHTLPPEEQALQSQEVIAQAAMKVGDTANGSKLLLDVENKRRMRKKADADLDRIDASTDVFKARAESIRNPKDKTKPQEPSVFMVGPDGGKLRWRKGVDRPIVGLRDPQTGKVVGSDGVEYEHAADAKEYNASAEEAPNDPSNNKPAAFKDIIGTTESKNLRNISIETMASARMVEKVGGAIGEAVQAGLDPSALAGAGGTFTNKVAGAFNALKGVGSVVIYAGAQRDEEGRNKGGKPMSVEDAASSSKFSDLIELPAGLEAAEGPAKRYRASIMQLAYLNARLAEPGGRLSDNDIKNSLESLAADSGNPNVVMQRLVESINERFVDYDNRVSQLRDRADAYGVDADKLEDAVVGRGTAGKLKASRDMLKGLLPQQEQPSTTEGEEEQAVPQKKVRSTRDIIDSLP